MELKYSNDTAGKFGLWRERMLTKIAWLSASYP